MAKETFDADDLAALERVLASGQPNEVVGARLEQLLSKRCSRPGSTLLG